jgi:hypothetical protein
MACHLKEYHMIHRISLPYFNPPTTYFNDSCIQSIQLI